MAVLKIISHGKNQGAAKRILQYVLNRDKTQPELCHVSGDYQADTITPRLVQENFLRVRGLFGKNGGRTYTHGTVSFAPGEITHQETAAFAQELVERIYPGHQVLTVVHTDTDHCHAHFVVEPVSYLDGSMLHNSKHDLAEAKKICNEMCRERGLSVARKGRHADGTAFSEGEVTTWDKNKWHQMAEDPKQSYLVELALAVQDCMAAAGSKEEFSELLEQEYGWSVTWKNSKKNIVFTNGDGRKVRDSNLNKTFTMNLSKEALQHEFARNSGRTPPVPCSSAKTPAAEQTDRTVGSRKPMAERAAEKSRRKGR